MSRFSGPQRAGASRELNAQRRAEAEQRQAAERERDRLRAEEYARLPVRELTDVELAELLLAAHAVAAINTVDEWARLTFGTARGNR